jgi:hypothetical protein
MGESSGYFASSIKHQASSIKHQAPSTKHQTSLFTVNIQNRHD